MTANGAAGWASTGTAMGASARIARTYPPVKHIPTAPTPGPLSFTASLAPSLFDNRDEIFLDHDHASNPTSVRRFHDELVAIEDGLYLATSHYRSGDDLHYRCHLALAKAVAGK